MPENAHIKGFLAGLAENKYSPRTVSTYRYPLRKLLAFLRARRGGIPLQDVTLEDLESYRLSMLRRGFSGESVCTYLQAARKFFAYLEIQGVIFSDPAARLVNPRVEKRLVEAPSVEELGRLLAAVDVSRPEGVRDRAMIETAYSCALRLNEILTLSLFNVDLDSRTLRVSGKGSRERALPLGTQAAKWLRLYISKARPELLKDGAPDALWLNREGRPLPASHYQMMLRTCAAKAQLDGKVTGHTLRRACATHMLRNGAHPVAIQRLLGHASLKHLGRYLKLTIPDLRNAHNESAVAR